MMLFSDMQNTFLDTAHFGMSQVENILKQPINRTGSPEE